MKRYNNFIISPIGEKPHLILEDVQPTVVQKPVQQSTDTGSESIEQLLDKLKKKLEEKHKSVESTNVQQTKTEGVDDKDTIKPQTDKIKELVKNTPKEKLNDMLTKCVNLITLTQKEIKGIESLKLNNDNVTKKINILKRNIQLLEDAKSDIVNKMGSNKPA